MNSVVLPTEGSLLCYVNLRFCAEENPIRMNNEQKTEVEEAVKAASARWQEAFNAGNAARCAAQYERAATMQADPFGTFEGSADIQAFWQKLINDGFAEVEYIDPQIEVLDEESAVLTAGWKMNHAKGMIHRELWILQPDGTAKLQFDHFEAQK